VGLSSKPALALGDLKKRQKLKNRLGFYIWVG
jgi:hypothetical protein